MVWLKQNLIFSLFVVIHGLSDEIYRVDTDVIVDDETLQEKWNFMESRIQEFIQSGVKFVLPRAIEASSSMNISSTCMKETLKVVHGMKKLKLWALKFLDATSKSIDGLLGQSFTFLGNYEECINNEVIDERSGMHNGKVLFRGKYCTVLIKPYLPSKPKRIRLFHSLEALKNFSSKDTIVGAAARYAQLLYYEFSLSIALCTPSGCSEEDINQVLRKVSNYTGTIIKIQRCEVKEDVEFTPAMGIVIVLYSIAGILMVVGSITDHCYSQKRRECHSVLIRILTSFSLISNFRKFTDTSASSGTFSCLHGIKSLTTAWITLTHTYLFSTLVLHRIPNGLTFPKDFEFQGLVNGTLAVDTFLFISGTLVCYGFIKTFKVEKRNFNVLVYVLHRFFRILPVYGFMTAFHFLVPLLGSGPAYHNAINLMYKPCLKNWWANLLFISNYNKDICMMHGWYLSLDMQFYIGALIILLPLVRWPKLGIVIAVTITVASMIGSWLTAYIYDFPPTFLYSPDIGEFFDIFTKYYIQPQTHAGCYCIGLLCGYLLVMYPKFKIPKAVQLLGWFSSIVVAMSVTNGVHKWNSGVDPNFWETFFYAGFHRVAWTLAVAWVILCCCTGHGGVVNYILSWKVWVPIGRLTLFAYLIGPLVQAVFLYTTRSEFYADHRTYVLTFFGCLVITYLLAFGGSMLVEAPFISLEKIVFSKRGNSESSDLKKQGSQTTPGGLSPPQNDFIKVEMKEKSVSINNGNNHAASVQRL